MPQQRTEPKNILRKVAIGIIVALFLAMMLSTGNPTSTDSANQPPSDVARIFDSLDKANRAHEALMKQIKEKKRIRDMQERVEGSDELDEQAVRDGRLSFEAYIQRSNMRRTGHKVPSIY